MNIIELENRANNMWSRGKLKEKESEQRVKAADLMRDASDLFRKAQEIYDQIEWVKSGKRGKSNSLGKDIKESA